MIAGVGGVLSGRTSNVTSFQLPAKSKARALNGPAGVADVGSHWYGVSPHGVGALRSLKPPAGSQFAPSGGKSTSSMPLPGESVASTWTLNEPLLVGLYHMVEPTACWYIGFVPSTNGSSDAA